MTVCRCRWLETFKTITNQLVERISYHLTLLTISFMIKLFILETIQGNSGDYVISSQEDAEGLKKLGSQNVSDTSNIQFLLLVLF